MQAAIGAWRTEWLAPGPFCTSCGETSRCAKPGRRKITFNWLYIRVFLRGGPPFDPAGQWASPLRTLRLLGRVEHPGTSSKLEISSPRGGKRYSRFVFQAVPFSSLLPCFLDLLLEGIALSGPISLRRDNGFGETEG